MRRDTEQTGRAAALVPRVLMATLVPRVLTYAGKGSGLALFSCLAPSSQRRAEENPRRPRRTIQKRHARASVDSGLGQCYCFCWFWTVPEGMLVFFKTREFEPFLVVVWGEQGSNRDKGLGSTPGGSRRSYNNGRV